VGQNLERFPFGEAPPSGASGSVSGMVILLLGMSAPALAVPPSPVADEPAPAVSPTQPDANDIPSETVSRFVNAYMAVVKLIESRELGLQRAETDTESRQMQQEIQGRRPRSDSGQRAHPLRLLGTAGARQQRSGISRSRPRPNRRGQSLTSLSKHYRPSPVTHLLR
jgi:hypothetical protein